MRVLIDIGHPADVHLFKNMAWNLIKHGHEVKFTAREKEIVVDLLDAYGFDYIMLGKIKGSLVNKLYRVLLYELKLLRLALKFKPDIFVGMVQPAAAHVSKVLRRPLIAFEDTESATLVHQVGLPFVDAVVTSTSFRKNLGKKQVRYNGYHELAYLHPNYFKPLPSILDELGLSENDKFIVVRFVSWEALHDRGQHGFTDRKTAIEELQDFGKVFITSEDKLENDLEEYRITVPPQHIHSLLYYASLYIGEGATMATEAAMLGTPSIYVSTLFETIAHYKELDKEYGLLYSFRNQEAALEKSAEILSQDNIKEQWKVRREKMLQDKIDVTQFMTDFVENYPQSFIKYKKEEFGKIL